MGVFFVCRYECGALDYCRDWRVVGLIRHPSLTTYKIHYVNYNLGRIVDNGSNRRCPYRSNPIC